MWGGLLFDRSGFRVKCEITLAFWVKPKDLGDRGNLHAVSRWHWGRERTGEDWSSLKERGGFHYLMIQILKLKFSPYPRKKIIFYTIQLFEKYCYIFILKGNWNFPFFLVYRNYMANICIFGKYFLICYFNVKFLYKWLLRCFQILRNQIVFNLFLIKN